MPEKTVSDAEWNEWLQHPCTKRLRAWANEQQARLKDAWARGEFSASFELEMLVKNAGATGACSVYEEVMDMDYNQIGVIDEEPVRADPSGARSPSGTV